MPKIMIVGEVLSDKDLNGAFSGPSHYILSNLLSQAGIPLNECQFTNVFNLVPTPRPEIINLCGPKADAIKGYPAITSGKYIMGIYAPQLSRLYAEINEARPTLIIALGAGAAWALLATSGIRKIRGSPSYTSGPAAAICGPIKVLPTYSMDAVRHEWTLRPIVLADLHKAVRESEYPDIRRPRREIYLDPNIDDLRAFERDFILPCTHLSVDIETAAGQITCIGFAPSVDRCLVIPFVDPMRSDGNYWRTLEDELAALAFVKRWCALPSAQIVGQNYLYDMHYLWRSYGITCPAQANDTMLLHHALQPELEKGLAFLETIYTDEPQHKFMRGKNETLKQED